MRNLIIIGMLLMAAFMAGWFTVDRNGETTTIEINREEIREDAGKLIRRGREFLDRQDQANPGYAPQPEYREQEQIARQPEWDQPYDGQYRYSNESGYQNPPAYNQSFDPNYPPPSYPQPRGY